MTDSQTPLNEDILIARLKRGDESALAPIEKHLYRRMLRAALQHTPCEQVAEDAVAITLAKIWSKRDLLPDSWADASRYILAMAGMAAIDLGRRKEERVSKVELDDARYLVAEEMTDDLSEDVEVALARIESLLLPQLNPRHTRILAPVAKRLGSGEDSMQSAYEGAAEEAGMSRGAVRNSWSDAGQKLQSVLRSMGRENYAEQDVRLILGQIGVRLGA